VAFIAKLAGYLGFGSCLAMIYMPQLSRHGPVGQVLTAISKAARATVAGALDGLEAS
jgi:hypothetical protein